MENFKKETFFLSVKNILFTFPSLTAKKKNSHFFFLFVFQKYSFFFLLRLIPLCFKKFRCAAVAVLSLIPLDFKNFHSAAVAVLSLIPLSLKIFRCAASFKNGNGSAYWLGYFKEVIRDMTQYSTSGWKRERLCKDLDLAKVIEIIRAVFCNLHNGKHNKWVSVEKLLKVARIY